MKTSRLLVVASLVASCHIDDLLKAPGSEGSATGSANARLAFTDPPDPATAGEPLATIEVTVLDIAGQPVVDFNGRVEVVLAENPGSATLSGTRNVPAENGVAKFSDLSIDKAADGYKLRATASGAAAATSDPFNIMPPPPPPPETGSLTVSTATTGLSLDLDGYTIALDGGGTRTIGANDNVTFDQLEARDYAVELGDVASNCTVSGDNPRTVSVPAGSTRETSFAISCTALPPPPPPPPPGGSTHLRFTDNPSTTQAGQTIQGRGGVRVTVFDGSGNQLKSFTGTISLEIGSNPGGGSLSGGHTQTITASMGGVVEWMNLAIDRPGNGYTLVATSPQAASGTSDPFDITSGPPPSLAGATGLGFAQEPTNATVGSPFSPAVRVVALAGGSVATGYNGAIWISLGSNPNGATLLGTRRVVAVNGVAVFNDLRVDRPGSGYTLRATAWPLNAKTSIQFNITP